MKIRENAVDTVDQGEIIASAKSDAMLAQDMHVNSASKHA